jgi:hypothetical protein
MKKIKTAAATIFLLLASLSCLNKQTDTYIVEQDMNVPVYMSYGEMRDFKGQSPARELVNPGKIYIKDNYLFVIEKNEGIHVIDVTDPTAPVNRTFINIPSCSDIAIRNNTIYAENHVDILLLDISRIDAITAKDRITNVLPYRYPAPDSIHLQCEYPDSDAGIVIGWKVKRVIRSFEDIIYPSDAEMDRGIYNGSWEPIPSTPGMDGSTGKSGSMARFGFHDNYLYVLPENARLQVFDVDETPINATTVYSIAGYETMFIHDNHIFFGASNGMYIYDMNMPKNPQLTGWYSHLTSCDPVVVQDHYAYITMRGGTMCNGTLNQLDIVALSDDYRTITPCGSTAMTQPYGLGIDGNLLFVCDGADGLKIYDAKDKKKITPVAAFPGIQAYDVIPAGNFLFMTGNDGFYLYDYSDPTDIRQLSHIPVKRG